MDKVVDVPVVMQGRCPQCRPPSRDRGDSRVAVEFSERLSTCPLEMPQLQFIDEGDWQHRHGMEGALHGSDDPGND